MLLKSSVHVQKEFHVARAAPANDPKKCSAISHLQVIRVATLSTARLPHYDIFQMQLEYCVASLFFIFYFFFLNIF